MKLSKKGKGGKKPRTVSFEIMFWKAKNGVIHIGTNDREGIGFNVAVRHDAGKPSGHPGLYRRLDAFLKMKGALDVSSN
jgi:hypothetical protein